MYYEHIYITEAHNKINFLKTSLKNNQTFKYIWSHITSNRAEYIFLEKIISSILLPLKIIKSLGRNIWRVCYLVLKDGYRILHNRVQFLFTYVVQFSSVQRLSHVRLFAIMWIAAPQAFLSITNSWSSHKLMSIEFVMPTSHLILCHPLLHLPPIPPSIRVFSNESTLLMRRPKYWSFSLASFLPKNTQD